MAAETGAERLHALYVDEVRQSLLPPVRSKVNRRQSQALIRQARTIGPAVCTEPDAATWIWSDLHAALIVLPTPYVCTELHRRTMEGSTNGFGWQYGLAARRNDVQVPVTQQVTTNELKRRKADRAPPQCGPPPGNRTAR